MTKKIEHFTNELKDLFPKENKASLHKHLTLLSGIQEDFLPEQEFKIALKTRLKNIQQIHTQNTSSFLSFFRFAGVFASFAFVSGFSYFYYTTQQVPIYNTQETQTLKNQLEDEELIQDIAPASFIQESIGDEGAGGNMILELKNSIQEKKSSQNTSVIPQASKKGLSSPELIKTQPETNIKNSGNSGTQEEKTLFIPQSPSENQENSDEYIVSDILDSYADNLSPEQDIPGDVPSVSSFSMESSRMIEPIEDIFFQTCLSYSGSLSQDGEKCFFEGEDFCTRENIFPESEKICKFLPKDIQKK